MKTCSARPARNSPSSICAAELHKVKVPALVLVGEQDEATPPPMSHELAAGLPDARLKIIPGCAHVPQLQSPRVFPRCDRGFPARHRRPAKLIHLADEVDQGDRVYSFDLIATAA